MALDCVMGIDVGTTSSRVTIYQSDGRNVAEGRAAHEASHPHPGWAEQQAEDWWLSVCTAARKALDAFPFPPESIHGVAVTSMRQSFVPLDEALRPLRPAILWYDTRHAAQVDWVQENIGVRKIYEITGSPPGRRAIYKVMWLKQNEPGVYERIHRIAFIPDYIQYLLTGELVSTPGIAMTSGCLNAASPLTWAQDLIAECGIDPSIWIPSIQPAGRVAGRVTPHAAAQIGLASGTPVVLSAGDQACGNLGVGVCQPGMLGINGGTSCALQTPSERLPIDQAMSYFVDFSPAGYYIAENGITSGTAALTDWFRAEFGREERESAGSEAELWQKLYDLALDAPPGNNGLILVPYLRGANGPLWDPRARGVLVGLMTEHGRADLMRAVFEGLAYESRKILESMEAGTGAPVGLVRTYGGASQSKVWNQIFADILARPVEVTCDPTPVSLGAAIVAGFGVGLYADPVEAVRSMIHIACRYEPDERFTALYDELYHDVYLHIYPPLQRIIETASLATTHRADPVWPGNAVDGRESHGPHGQGDESSLD